MFEFPEKPQNKKTPYQLFIPLILFTFLFFASACSSASIAEWKGILPGKTRLSQIKETYGTIGDPQYLPNNHVAVYQLPGTGNNEGWHTVRVFEEDQIVIGINLFLPSGSPLPYSTGIVDLMHFLIDRDPDYMPNEWQEILIVGKTTVSEVIAQTGNPDQEEWKFGYHILTYIDPNLWASDYNYIQVWAKDSDKQPILWFRAIRHTRDYPPLNPDQKICSLIKEYGMPEKVYTHNARPLFVWDNSGVAASVDTYAGTFGAMLSVVYFKPGEYFEFVQEIWLAIESEWPMCNITLIPCATIPEEEWKPWVQDCD